MNKLEALEIWHHDYGDNEYAHDINGRKIKRDDYMVLNQVGWVVAYMHPLALGGSKNDGNTIILHHHTASEKGDKYPYFSVDETPYAVRYDEKGDFYYIEEIDKYSSEYRKEFLEKCE